MTVFPYTPGVLQATASQRKHLGFPLNQLCAANPQIAHGIAITVDGIPLAASQQVSDQVSDQLAAAPVGRVSLANGISETVQRGDPASTGLEEK